jgi:hypothetical protein
MARRGGTMHAGVAVANSSTATAASLNGSAGLTWNGTALSPCCAAF